METPSTRQDLKALHRLDQGTSNREYELLNKDWHVRLTPKLVNDATGVLHGVGLPTFAGVRVLFSPQDTRIAPVNAIKKGLEDSGVESVMILDPGQPPGAIYVYVGYKA